MEFRGGKRRARARAMGYLFALLTGTALPLTQAVAGAQILYFEPLHIRVPQSASGAAQQKSSRDLSQLEFSAFGREYTLSVQANETFHASLVSKPKRSSLMLYRGAIDGLAQSWVRLATHGMDVHGMLWDGAQLYVIAPRDEIEAQLVPPLESAASTVIFRLQDVLMPTQEASCAAQAPSMDEQQPGSEAYASLLRELKGAHAKGELGVSMKLELSVLADALFLERYVDEHAARDSLLVRLNNIDGIYSSQLGVQIQAPIIDVLDAKARTLSDTRNAETLLKELSGARDNSPRLRSRGLTHLFTGRDLHGTTVGMAYIDSLCDRKYGVGLTEVSTRGSWYESLIAAHEIGHNFGAVHDGEAGKACASTPQGQYLMSPNVNGVDAFSECSLQLMRPNVASAQCIVPLPAANVRVEADLGTVRKSIDTSFDYALPVANSGGATSMNVRAEILVPPSILVEDAYVIGGSCTSGAGFVQCYLGNIAGGTSRPVYFTLRGQQIGASSISIRVFADNETDTSDNSGAGTIAIDGEVDISVAIEAPAHALTQSPFEVRFTVANSASIDANDVRVSLALPSGFTATRAVHEGGTCTIEASEVACTIPRLEARGSASGAFTLVATQVGQATLRLVTSGSYLDPVAANDSATATIEIEQAAARAVEASEGRAGNGGGGSASVLFLGVLGLLARWHQRQVRA